MKSFFYNIFTPRIGFPLLALSCVFAICFALYQQYANYITPCPLCIMQRIAVITVGVLALVFAIFNPRRLMLKVAALVMSLVALSGVGFAARQLWLQSLPANQVPACGPGLQSMLEMMPFWRVVSRVLKGTGDCAVVNWRFLGMSLAFWSLLFLLTSAIFVWLVAWNSSKKPADYTRYI